MILYMFFPVVLTRPLETLEIELLTYGILCPLMLKLAYLLINLKNKLNHIIFIAVSCSSILGVGVVEV